MMVEKKTKKAIKIILVIAVIIFMINILQIPEVIKCEILTAMHGHEFEERIQALWSGEILEFKVLSYSTSSAEIYYVCDADFYICGKISGFKQKLENEWELAYDTVSWSHGGTINGYVMPYWWHNFPNWLVD